MSISGSSYDKGNRGKRGQYMHPTRELKIELIELLESSNISVLQAANEVGLKYSTAKHIYQHYKQTGEVEKVIIKVEEDTTARDHFLFNLSRQIL